MPSKTLALMSGGVDSSAVAAILSGQGVDVIGITMKVWDEPGPGVSGGERAGGHDLPHSEHQEIEDPAEAPAKRCCSLTDVEDARRICARLKIPHYVSNVKAAFQKHVVDPFCEEYLVGRTPNPCIVCNTEIKFRLMLRKATALGADNVATGHYARIERDEGTGRPLLLKGRDTSKDQSYFLYELTQRQLGRIIFPLGEMTKKQVRAHARELGLGVAEKPESQEICFVPGNDYRKLLERMAPERLRPGKIVDLEGKELGEHKGIAYYTIGQRRGLGIAHPSPLYVVSLDVERAAVVVGTSEHLWSDELVAEKLNWISISKLKEPMRVQARIRYRHEAAHATISPLEGGAVRVHFDERQRAITPGQATVFYDGEVVVGGGVIGA